MKSFDISGCNESQKEEIAAIESIISITEPNKELVCRTVDDYIKKLGVENSIMFIFRVIEHASNIRPKERKSLLFLINFIIKSYDINKNRLTGLDLINNMLKIDNTINDGSVFDFSEKNELIEALFEDNVEYI